MAASSSSSTGKWKYDVFLSFRGEDTRGGFTDHLYTALKRKGIFTFRDENEIKEGTDISSDLSAAIEASRIAVVVMSENYASSRWCLGELLKIFECRERSGMTVLPIFYRVDPSDVRNQRGTFAEAFARHEERFGEDDLRLSKWRQALTQLANLKAWLSQHWSHESEIIEEICTAIWKRIKPSLILTHEDQLVGINSKLDKLFALLNSNSDDDGVVWIGIHGMGGIGKTTIARVFYEKIRDEFDAHCFLSDVREKCETSGLPYLQSKLLSRTFSMKNNDIWDAEEGIAMISKAIFRKRTLIVLDDVDHSDQIIGLIPSQDSFGFGSRVIITTRNADLLSNELGVKRIFEIEELKHEEAVQHLNLSIFMKTCPEEGYLEHSKNIVKLVGGHPLALKLLGTSLRNKDSGVWNCVIEELQEGGNIHNKIFKCLKVSYDGLDDWEKEIFLDVACFFKGKGRDVVEEILDGCGFYAKRRIELLIQKSLITLSYDNKLEMHDLLQEMGQKIVRQKPTRQDRLWCHKDIKSVVTEALVQSIFFKSTRNTVEVPILFSRMHQLRLLNLHNVRLKNHLEYCIPTELRYLKWTRYPLEFLPLNSEEYKLISLHMCHSNLKQFWLGEKNVEELKDIKLSHSQKLFKTPDFAKIPNLRRLELEGCTSLINIHPSIFVAEKLIFLNLKDCINLTNLPCHINIKVLQVLILSGCSKLKKIPDFSGNTNRVLQLHLDGTSITSLPSSIASLNCLTMLSLENCKKLVNISSAIHKMASLQTLNLSGCSKLAGNRKRKADDVGCSDELDVRGTPRRRRNDDNIFKKLFLLFCRAFSSSSIFEIPSLSGLYSLTELILSNCNLQAVPEGIECLVSLRDLDLRGNNFSQLPTSIAQLYNLKKLNISQCKNLVCLPKMPARILWLSSRDCFSLKNVSDISKLDQSCLMRKVNLLNCYRLADNKQLHSWLTSWMLKMLFRKGTFDIMIPGSEIPDWFTTTKVGSSISVKLDANAINDKFITFALCVVCGVTGRDNVANSPFGIIASMRIKNSDVPNSNKEDLWVNGFFVGNRMGKSDHIWMFILPQTTSISSMISKCREIEFQFNFGVNYSRSIPLNVEFRKCGVRLINIEEEMKARLRHSIQLFLEKRR